MRAHVYAAIAAALGLGAVVSAFGRPGLTVGLAVLAVLALVAAAASAKKERPDGAS